MRYLDFSTTTCSNGRSPHGQARRPPISTTAPTIIEIPAEIKGLAGPIQALVDKVADERKKHSRGGSAVDYDSVENEYSDMAAEFEVAAHGVTLESLGTSADRVEMNGRLYCRVLEGKAEFRTKAGPVPVTRWLYREIGGRSSERSDVGPHRSADRGCRGPLDPGGGQRESRTSCSRARLEKRS